MTDNSHATWAKIRTSDGTERVLHEAVPRHSDSLRGHRPGDRGHRGRADDHRGDGNGGCAALAQRPGHAVRPGGNPAQGRDPHRARHLKCRVDQGADGQQSDGICQQRIHSIPLQWADGRFGGCFDDFPHLRDGFRGQDALYQGDGKSKHRVGDLERRTIPLWRPSPTAISMAFPPVQR